jgi:hypothetical protein
MDKDALTFVKRGPHEPGHIPDRLEATSPPWAPMHVSYCTWSPKIERRTFCTRSRSPTLFHDHRTDPWRKLASSLPH